MVFVLETHLLLNTRLSSIVNINKVISKNQIGFQSASRTSDHLLTLKALINKHVRDNSKQKVHAAFIDFRKAFDNVWHNGLFEKLEKSEIDQNFLRTIQSIYKNTECAVKHKQQMHQFL